MDKEAAYLELLLEPIRVCAHYKPRFGQGNKQHGLTLDQFQMLYQSDPFYNWFGLDNPLIYAAHKTAGGITSIYRQIGIGCERLFRAILRDTLDLSEAEVSWSYQVSLPEGKTRTLYLDARISLGAITDTKTRARFQEWMMKSARELGVDEAILSNLNGTVFEVRQGYKSKDSKRQNADLANAATAYTKAYLPCLILLSTQIDMDVLERYKVQKWVVLTGLEESNSPLYSTYSFMREIIGYDLAAFFRRHSATLRQEIERVLRVLLVPQEVPQEV